MIKRTLIALSLSLAVSFAADPAVAFIQGKDADMQNIVKADPKIGTSSEAKVRTTLLSLFDSKEVAKQALGKSKALWEQNAKLQDRYAKALTEVIVRQNISVLRRNGVITTTFANATKKVPAIPSALEVVGTTVVKGQNKSISYIVIPVSGNWRAVDVKVGSVSTYGTLVQALLKKNNNDLTKVTEALEKTAEKEK